MTGDDPGARRPTDRDYRTVLGELTGLAAQADADRAEANRWYADRLAALDEAQRAAERAVRDTHRDVRQAQRDREEVDARAAGLWSDFVHRIGPAAERYGRTVPEPVVPRQRDDRGPHDYLQQVATRLAYTPPARSSTAATTALLMVLGAVGGALGFAVGQALRSAGQRAGGDWAVGLPVVALILMVTGPVLGVAIAKRTADRRGVPLDAATAALVLAAGLVTTGLLYAALR